MLKTLSEKDIQRYAHQIILKNIGFDGQKKLLMSKVFILGIGGLGSPVSMYLADIYTLSANLAGLPGMSIPAGFSNNLPVGLQLIGNYWSESILLNIAHKFQQQTDWHNKAPKEY